MSKQNSAAWKRAVDQVLKEKPGIDLSPGTDGHLLVVQKFQEFKRDPKKFQNRQLVPGARLVSASRDGKPEKPSETARKYIQLIGAGAAAGAGAFKLAQSIRDEITRTNRRELALLRRQLTENERERQQLLRQQRASDQRLGDVSMQLSDATRRLTAEQVQRARLEQDFASELERRVAQRTASDARTIQALEKRLQTLSQQLAQARSVGETLKIQQLEIQRDQAQLKLLEAISGTNLRIAVAQRVSGVPQMFVASALLPQGMETGIVTDQQIEEALIQRLGKRVRGETGIIADLQNNYKRARPIGDVGGFIQVRNALSTAAASEDQIANVQRMILQARQIWEGTNTAINGAITQVERARIGYDEANAINRSLEFQENAQALSAISAALDGVRNSFENAALYRQDLQAVAAIAPVMQEVSTTAASLFNGAGQFSGTIDALISDATLVSRISQFIL